MTTDPDTEAARTTETTTAEETTVNAITSPDGTVEVSIGCRDGRPEWSVTSGDRTVIRPSTLGLQFRDRPSLDRSLTVTGTETETVDETWSPRWGAYEEVRNHYRELRVDLERTDGDGQLGIVARAYDDGAAVRYVLPEQPGREAFAIVGESTGFRFDGDHTAWSIPPDPDSYEFLYDETPLSDVDGAHTPLTIRADEDLVYSVHEAALLDYAAMTLSPTRETFAFQSELTTREGHPAVAGELPHRSPWRTVTIGSDPGDLVESSLIVNLNEPSRIDDPWVEAAKYAGIWWEIHIGKSSWRPGPDLGATTANARRYVDFAAENDIPALLVEGWNKGWEYGGDAWKGQEFTTPNDEYDLEEVVAYAADHGVDIVGHAETGGDVENFEDQLDEAFELYGDLGMVGVKTGYAGSVPDGTHHDQRMVRHHQRVIETAAEHGLLVDIHEGIKPTGLRRTYPNLMTSECVRGMEFNAWSDGNPPDHTVTLPFTRMLGGPVDYTPGIFGLRFEDRGGPGAFEGEISGDQRVHSTRARQLALYPILLSGLQMVADLPENYEGEPEFEFLRAVPATWDDTRVLDAAIGRHVTIARRSGEEWFVGTGTDEQARTLAVPLDFLGEGEYDATIYEDAPETDLDDNPEAVRIRTVERVTSEDSIEADVERGGGQAIHLVPR